MTDKNLIMLNIPGREDASVHFIADKAVSNDVPYPTKYVRRLAWVLMQALPVHVIEALLFELMLQAQELIMRGARMDAMRQNKRVVFAVRDTADAISPGPLQIWMDNDSGMPVPPTGPADAGDEELDVVHYGDDVEDEVDE